MHVFVTSVLVDDLIAAWLVEMISNIEMCISKCRGTGFTAVHKETHCHCLKRI